MESRIIEAEIRGRFVKKGKFIYRTHTYIQYPGSDEIIGACVLCNPGSSRLLDPMEQEKLENLEEGYVEGELLADPTMGQLCKILKALNFDKKGGKFMIYNTFTLRNGDMNKALEEFKDEEIDKRLLFDDFYSYKELQNELPWTLIGWGCKSDPVLNEIKKDWLEYLEKENLTIVGSKHKNNPHYYHPKPFIKQDQEEYIKLLVDKIEKLKDNNINY